MAPVSISEENQMSRQRLDGKVAIVTGAGGGIGKGCALAFAEQGAKVVGCDINGEAAAATAAEAKAQGWICESRRTDLTSEADVKTLVDYTISTFGRLDILVNAGATAVFAWIEDMTLADWKKTLQGELDVVFLACKESWPHLKKSGAASIINFASANAYVALEGSPALAHCAGKGGVLAMTRQLAMEGGPHNIRANTLSPGLIVTPATSPVIADPKFLERVLTKKMIKRVGQPKDIAMAAIFLASDESSWITGTDLSVDGGATAW